MLIARSAAAACLLVAVNVPRCAPPTLCADDDDPTSSFFRRQLSSLPDDPERSLLQMRASLRATLDASHRVWVDIKTPSMDGASRGFEPKLLARFALGAAQEIDGAFGSECGPPVILAHGLATGLELTQQTRDTLLAGSGGTAAIVPLAPGSDEVGSMVDPDALARLADGICPVVVVGPFEAAEHAVARAAREESDGGRVVLLLNHRPVDATETRRVGLFSRLSKALGPPPPPPLLTPMPTGYEAAFELIPLALAKSALVRGQLPPDADADSGFSFIPKAVLCRRYPIAWALLVDGNGLGYEDAKSFDRRPGPAALIDAVGRHVRTKQGDDDGVADTGLYEGVGAGGGASMGERATGPTGPTMPTGVEYRTWQQIDSAPIQDDAIRWYTAGCLLRMREDAARDSAGAGGRRVDTVSDEYPNAVHLFAAEPDGWRARRVELTGCALLLLDSATPGDGDGRGGCVRVEQLAVAAGASPWSMTLLDAAESLAAAREQSSVAVRAAPDTAWQLSCTGRGYVAVDGDGGDGRVWMVKRIEE